MKRLFAIVLLASCVAGGAVASAQVLPQIPDLQNRIPAPLPPPPEAPIINGPVTQSPPPGALAPPSLNTFGDRATQCLQEGSGGGLSGSRLDAYTGACANEERDGGGADSGIGSSTSAFRRKGGHGKRCRR